MEMNEEQKIEGAISSTNTLLSAADGETLISRARAEREALLKENERLERNIIALREVEAARLLGGTAGGYVPQIQSSEADLKKKAAMDFWKGTAIEDAIAKS